MQASGFTIANPSSPPLILIAGGGVGGLAAGLALRRAGFDAQVFEQAEQPRDSGAGLWLWPNAISALHYLGVADAVRAAGIVQAASVIRDRHGHTLAHIAPRATDGSPMESVAIHRPALLGVLRDALGDDAIRRGCRVVGFEQDRRGVRLRFADGREAVGDALVGADGLLSAVRAQMIGDGPPRDAGFTAWRAVVPAAEHSVPSGMIWGRGGRFGFMPLGEGRLNWFGVTLDPPPVADPVGRKAFLTRHFADWPDSVTTVIAATPPEAILAHRVHDRPPLDRWSRGCVTLLGDAAHPMTPSLGQGACQALEDAVVLAHSLGLACSAPGLSDGRGSWDLPAALAAYEGLRRPRANAVASRSRRMDALIQWSWPPACMLRDAAAAALPDALRQRFLAPMWRFDPPEG